MKYFAKQQFHLILGILALAVAIISCSGGDNSPNSPPPENGEISSSSGVQSYCIYLETKQCFNGTNPCPGGGILSLECPADYNSSGGTSSSSEDELKPSSSSSDAATLYAYCIFAAESRCLMGDEPISICPPGGEPSNACPYLSSSSVGISSSIGGVSSSSTGKSSNSNGTCSGGFSGGVFIDPRDCQAYKYETAPNGTVWMSENLNYSKSGTIGYCYKTGNSPESLCNTMEDLYKCFSTEKNSATCINFESEYPYCFLGKAGENLSGCDSPYGRAYTWETAMDGNLQRGVCPTGWHIPNVAEWTGIKSSGMSNGFYVITGNFNTNGKYPPLGWKERTGSAPYGFYWTRETSGTGVRFAGMQIFNSGDRQVDVDADLATRNNDYFFVRCISDETSDFPQLSSSSVSTPSSSSGNVNPPSNSLTDSRDGKTYKTVVIGTQTWMAENLNYNASGSKCYENLCGSYGRLYNWATAMDISPSCNSSSCTSLIQINHKGFCPEGWHIPSDTDWNILMAFVHSNNGLGSYASNSTSIYAGKYLKAKTNWTSYNGITNEDSYGFAALPGGVGYSDDSFKYAGSRGYWWSTSEINAGNAYPRNMEYSNNSAYWNSGNKTDLFSIRCLKN